MSSKAIVIKHVNFLTNKLDTVSLTGEVPCTGVSLNKSTVGFTKIGATETLTATLTPANTTDSVSWVSSNTDAVTVNNGQIIAVGIGSATITATCGTHSATCAVTVTNQISFSYVIGNYNHKSEATGQDYVYNEIGSSAYASLESTSVVTTKRIRNPNTNMYPLLLGSGATKVTITVPSTMRATVWFTDSNTACDYAQDHPTFDYLAKLISGDASAYDGTVALGTRVVDVPEGADSIALSLQYPGGTITDEIMANVTVVAS